MYFEPNMLDFQNFGAIFMPIPSIPPMLPMKGYDLPS